MNLHRVNCKCCGVECPTLEITLAGIDATVCCFDLGGASTTVTGLSVDGTYTIDPDNLAPDGEGECLYLYDLGTCNYDSHSDGSCGALIVSRSIDLILAVRFKPATQQVTLVRVYGVYEYTVGGEPVYDEVNIFRADAIAAALESPISNQLTCDIAVVKDGFVFDLATGGTATFELPAP